MSNFHLLNAAIRRIVASFDKSVHVAGLVAVALGGLFATPPALGQWVVVARNDSAFKGVLLADDFDGSVIDVEWIDATSNNGFHHAALQVGEQVWVSDSLNSVIYRYALNFAVNPPVATFLDTIGAGDLTNPSGMAVANGVVYVAGSTIQGLATFDPDGHFVARAEQFNLSSADVEVFYGGLLVTDGSNHEIRFYDFDMQLVDLFRAPQPGVLSPMQVKRNGATLEVLAGWFGGGFPSAGLYHYDGQGNQLDQHSIGPTRGVYPLGDGNILVTSGGLRVFDTSSNTLSLVANVAGAQIEPLRVFVPGCGNGLLEAGEACDDGNTLDLDGCDSDCTVGALCGNGILESGEQCDDGNLTDDDGCNQDCTVAFVCGNGILEPGEGCDDGNPLNGDGCDAACVVEFDCGNGTIEMGEQCDGGRGCSAACELVATCGNGSVEPGEQCDDGGTLGGDGCDGQCRVEPVNGGTCISVETQELNSPNQQTDGGFGINVQVDGCRMIVGAIEAFAGLTDAGAAYVFGFEAGNWQLTQALQPTDPQSFANFGDAVGLDGNVAAVGAVAADSAAGQNTGAVYVFRANGLGHWKMEAKLTLSAADVENQSNLLIPSVTEGVAVSGDAVLVGGRFYSVGGLQVHGDSGAAWVFREVGGQWVEEAKLIAPDVSAGAEFGTSVDLDGDVAAIGAAGDDSAVAGGGSAYVYRRVRGQWVQEVKLVPEGLPANARFGNTVGVSGATVVVGAPNWPRPGGFGAVSVYRQIGLAWVEEARLFPGDSMGDGFGWSVDVDGDTIVVGAEVDDESASVDGIDSFADSGAAYVYRRLGESWVEAGKFLAEEGFAGDRLGRAVSVSGDHVAVGAKFHDTLAAGGNEGGVFVFEQSEWLGDDCNGNGASDACDIALGLSSDADSDDVPDECVLTGDLNGDDVVDLSDHTLFYNCLTGPGGGVLTDCDGADFDTDIDVDLGDFGILQSALGT